MEKHTPEIPDYLQEFISQSKWTFAKTMPQWPHEYIVRGRVDDNNFVQLVKHIRANGHEGKFYKSTFIYYEYEGRLYWTMGEPVDKTTIINRCKIDDSYGARLKNGTLPMEK